MNRSSSLTIVAVVALVGLAAFPMAATATADLSVDVDQNPETGEAVVTVTDNESAVENATVEVTSESAYAGNDTYETDSNGTVALPNPNETVTVTVNATANGTNASSEVELVPYDESLDVEAEQNSDGTAAVTVTQYDEAVENATVDVETEGNYSGAGTYATDEDGTVTLDQPENDQTATVAATVDNLTAETSVELNGSAELEVAAEQRDDGVFVTVTHGSDAVENATVDVETEGDYSGAGTYATDADGEVALPLPQENVTIAVTAAAENETAETTTELTVEFVEEQGPFGQAVSKFVGALQSTGFDGPPGQVISDFVTTNNPGNADGNANGADDRGAEGGNETAENDSAVAPGRSDDAPGQSAEAGGQSADASGGSDEAPGRANASGGDDANRSGDASDRSGESPDQADDDSTESDGANESDAESSSPKRGSNGGDDGGSQGNSGDAPGRN